jgi:hypothetical protein
MDISKYLIFGVFGPLFITWSKVDNMLNDGNDQFMWAIFLLYGLTIITFSYVASFYFKKSSNS